MKASASPYASTGPGVPGTTGTPTFMAIERTFTRCQSNHPTAAEQDRTERAGLCLVTKSIDDFWCGTDKGDTSLLDFLGELSILRQETVTEG